MIDVGKSEYKIQSAKNRAVGGGRKRCTKGKSCSATCIAANKVCLVEIPWVAASGVSKVASEVKKVKGGPRKEPKEQRMPPLETSQDYKETLNSTYWSKDENAVRAHAKIRDILKGTAPENVKEREKLLSKIGGMPALERGILAIEDFTKENYGPMREVQLDAKSNKELYDVMEKALLQRVQDAEKLIAALPKEQIVKFRGISVDYPQLNAMIMQSHLKGDFSDGALASWSTSLYEADFFSKKGSKDGAKTQPVILRTVNKKGVAIDSISSIQGESEILTSGGAKYKYTGNYRVIDSGGIAHHVFDVVEY